ncbi:hypothetical protein IC575_003792 [Cucumis melo]
MDPQILVVVLIVFIVFQRQMLLTLEPLMNDNKRLPYTPYDTRHRIRQFEYFRMIHESDLVCRQSTCMDKRTFAILCHLLRIFVSLSSTEIVDVEEMVVMFLYILAHDMNNRVIQRKFVRSGETVSRHFSLMLLAVVRLHDELIKKLVPVTNHLHKSTMEVFRGTCSRSHLYFMYQYVSLIHGRLFKNLQNFLRALDET